MNKDNKAKVFHSIYTPSYVNCASLSHKSARVFATAELDSNVSLWASGNPECILKFSNLPSLTESLKFNTDEVMLAAGASSGIIKVFDLQEGKEICTLPGHKAPTTEIQFHPFGNYLISGSKDSNIKLWDLRIKDVVNTYRDHKGPITCFDFSPDGKWLASGSDDKTVKLWDLKLGKMIQSFGHHTDTVNHIRFHPDFFIMATASKDRSVNLYNLEDFSLKYSSDSIQKISTPINNLYFYSKSDLLYVATGNYLKICNYEDFKQLESVNVGWNEGFCEMSMPKDTNHLIGLTASNMTVTTYVVDVLQCAPFVKPSSPVIPYEFDVKPNTPNDVIDREFKHLEDVVKDITSMHDKVNKGLMNRYNKLAQLRTFWYPQNIANVIDKAINLKENAVIIDIFTILIQQEHLISLDIGMKVLPCIKENVSSRHERHVEISCQILKIILIHFSKLIKQNMSNPPNKTVDICQEERYEKCKCCYNYLIQIRDIFTKQSVTNLLVNEVLILLNLLVN